MQSLKSTGRSRWFVGGDVDGFFGLALDNLVQLLLIDVLCRFVLGFPTELLHGRILPGVALSVLLGNMFYAWQAKRLAERDGRDDVCALPYGINTVSLFAYVFLVMLPAKMAAQQAGAPDPALVAWRAGLLACLGSGIIEFGGAFFAEKIRKATPRAALLSTLAGIALGFISLGFLYRTFARPVIGLTTLGIILLVYFGGLRFKGSIPGGLVAVVLGTLIAWLIGISPDNSVIRSGVQFNVPVPVIYDLWLAIKGGFILQYISIILPMGLFNVMGSLQNIESAEAGGDAFDTRSSLAVNGLGTLVASCFGSCFPTTIYIGHAGWKGLGARVGYSILNAAFVCFICLTGTLAYIVWAVPVDAGMAIVLWIGLVITAQAFQATDNRHAPAVVVGILPGVGAWGALMIKQGISAASQVVVNTVNQAEGMSAVLERADEPLKTLARRGLDFTVFSDRILAALQARDVWAHGAFALEQGCIFSAMFLAALTVYVIERRFLAAAMWAWIAALVSLSGLMHSYQWFAGGTGIRLYPAWEWALGYALMGACFLLARWTTEPGPSHQV